MQQKRWLFHEAAPERFLRAVPEHPLLAQVLYNRGLRTDAAVAAFLNDADAIAENPYRLRDMVPAVQRIVQAIRRGETICVYGDFDVDGVCATALLVSALQAAGGRVGPYIPDRVDEGYGLNVDAIERISGQAQLLITVDCGIRSVAEVQRAVELGMDVIVTDHHSVGVVLPPALAVINPRRPDCPSRFDRLAGAGVAYRLAQAVLRAIAQERWGRLSPAETEEQESWLLDLVALGTVADIMPLLGENRRLVQRGLARLNREPRTGIGALMLEADLRPGSVDATAVAFRLAPRMNAAGRLASAALSYELLRTDDVQRAADLAALLETLNKTRRALTEAAHAEAEQQIAAQMVEDPVILIVGSEQFQQGIVGSVAGRLADRFYRPAVVMSQEADETRGSARSIPEFNISQALDEVSELLIRHGGHQAAAGFTVKTARLPELTASLQEIARRSLGGRTDLHPSLTIDAETTLDEINWGLADQFARLEPTGEQNPPPLLLARACHLRGVRTVGGGKHLKLVLESHPTSAVYDAIGFSLGEWHGRLTEGDRIDAVFQLEVNEWQGSKRLQLNLQDLRASDS